MASISKKQLKKLTSSISILLLPRGKLCYDCDLTSFSPLAISNISSRFSFAYSLVLFGELTHKFLFSFAIRKEITETVKGSSFQIAGF